MDVICKFFVATLICVLFSISSITNAASITSVNANELSGATIIDFNNYSSGTYSSLSAPGIEITGTGTFNFMPILAVSGVGFYNDSNTNWTITLLFDDTVSAFGIWSGAIEENWTYTAFDAQGNAIESTVTGISTNPIFHGIAANGIKSVTMSNVAEDIAIFDDLYFVPSVATVPVPAAVWLFGSGLLGLIGFAKRKRK